MRRRMTKVAAVLLAVVLLFAVPRLVGCGEDGGSGGSRG